MESPRLVQLRNSVKELHRLLLPSRFDPTGSYIHAGRVRTRTASFRVLGHAELESYFEDRVVEIVNAALSAWKQRRYVSSVTMHLLGFSGREMSLPPESVVAPSDNKRKIWPELIDISDRFERSVSQYVRYVTKENHGIKEKNIMLMLLPIGFHHSNCDQLLLTNLEQFGESRGMVAHNSSSAYITQSVDPKDEYDRILKLISDIQPIDEGLTTLLEDALGP